MGVPVTVISKNIHECIAASCDVSTWENEKGELLDEAAKEAEALFSAFGMECNINSAGKATGMFALAVTSAVAALFFL